MPDDIRDGIDFSSTGDRAADAPDGRNRNAGVDDSTATTADKLAARAGLDDTAPLGDPDAPQGSGPETDTSKPENRPAPMGKIRTSYEDGEEVGK